MKDIDFDELDRAVSSLLNQDKEKEQSQSQAPTGAPASPALAPAAASAAAPVVDPATTQPVPGGLPVIETPITISAAGAAPAPQPSSLANKAVEERKVGAAPIVPNRSGRFMDVVRPQPTKQADAVIDTPKQVNLKPITPTDPTLAPEPLAKPDPETAPVPVSLGAIAEPDPRTLTAEPEVEEETWAESSESKPEGEPAAETPMPVIAASAAPEQSPFLADAVVEKRPLGAFVDQHEEDTEAKPDDPADDQLPPEPAPAEKKLPPELNQNLVDLEGTEQPDNPPAAASQTAAASSAPADTASKNLGAMSIPQQYKTAERPAASAEAPVFDTTQYHAPIPFADQRKSNKGLWILLIVLLLLIIAGVAYWFYFLY